MESKIFEELLLDLYDVYNSSKKKDVERLVKSYNGREFDAIKTVLIKYNFKGHPGYNENANRDEYVTYLISKYSDGERPLSKEKRLEEIKFEEQKNLEKEELERQKKKEQSDEERRSISELGENVKEAIKNEVNLLKEDMERRLKSKMDSIDEYLRIKKQEIESKVLDFSGGTHTEIIREVENQNKAYTQINIENLNFTDSDIQLPPEHILETLAKGTKMILKNSEGRVCGVEVKDITIDSISYEGEIVKEIILEKI